MARIDLRASPPASGQRRVDVADDRIYRVVFHASFFLTGAGI
jgi:hypothetical protein